MNDLPEFDPYNPEHIEAWKEFCVTGVWPPECDVKERGSNPCWVILIQSKLAEAWVNNYHKCEGY
jgi:hypothetical protein